MLIGGDNGDNVIISESGNNTLIGGKGNNTLTGGTGKNIFIHQDGANDIITNYDNSEDIIILPSGKISESLKSDDGNDTILKIADDNKNLGTITIKDASNKFLMIYDIDHINNCKEVITVFSNTYAEAAIKTFEEDEDIQSILNDGENSAVLTEIKEINPELAAQIAKALKLSYNAGVTYLEGGITSSSSDKAVIKLSAQSNDSYEDFLKNLVSIADFEASVLAEIDNMGKSGEFDFSVAKKLSKFTGPLSVGLASISWFKYASILKESGNLSGIFSKNFPTIRSHNPEVFDSWAKSNVDLAFAAGGFLAGLFMGGVPAIIAAGACFAAPLVINWAYDELIAPKLDAEANKLQSRMQDNFISSGGEKFDQIVECWHESNDNGGYYYEALNYKNNITLYGTHGRDHFMNYGTNVHIVANAGNDVIFNYKDNVTIEAGTGNDKIYNYGSNVLIDVGNGNDSVFNYGYNSNVSIKGGSGSIKEYRLVPVPFRLNSMTADYDTNNIDNAYNDSTIEDNTVNDSISNNGINVNIQGSGRSTINSGSGDDYISVSGGQINAGAGNDSIYIYSSGSNIMIDGEVDDDLITNNAESFVTINTAQGNDTIKLGTATKSFTAEGFDAGDVIQLYSAATKLETISGGIKAGNVSISGVEGIATVNNSWSTSTNSIAYNQSTVAGAKLSGKTITYDTLSGTENLFTISGIKSTTGVSLSGKEITLNNAALKNVTGTVLSISGGDYKLKLASDVDTLAEDKSGWTTLKSGNVAYLEGGKGSYYSLSSDGKSVTYNEAVAGTNKVEFGGVKGTPTISGNTVSLTANNFNGNVSVASNAGNYQFALSGAFGGKKFTGTAKADKISNSGSNISIDGGAGNDTFTNSGANVTLTGGKGNDVFAYSKGNFKITDYTASADKISLDIAGVQDVALNNKDVTLKLGQSDTVTIVGGKDKKITVAKSKTAQYIFGDHVILNTGKTSASLTSAATTFDATSYSKMVTVDGAKTNSAVQIVGNAKANKIYVGAKGSTLNGGKGNDTLYGGAGTDIVVYANKTGNDVIQNYTSGKDKISLTSGASLAGFSVNTSGDAVLKVGSNNLTIKKADGENISTNGKKITIIDAAGNETTKTYFTNRTVSGKGVTLNAEYSGSFTASSAIVSVDATQNENPLVINGNSKNNILSGGTGNDKLYGQSGNDSLWGGEGKDILNGGKGNDSLVGGKGNDKLYGQSGNDSLWGGAGNDSLYGSSGNDTFIYKPNEGTDKIFDYQSGDILQILKSDGTAGGSFKSSKFSGGALTLTINGGGSVIFDGVAKRDKFNINGKTYTISGSKLK